MLSMINKSKNNTKTSRNKMIITHATKQARHTRVKIKMNQNEGRIHQQNTTKHGNGTNSLGLWQVECVERKAH